MSKDFEFQTKMYESLRKAAGIRPTPEGRTLIFELDEYEGGPNDPRYDMVFHEVYRAPLTGNPYEDGNRDKLYDYVGRLQFESIAELFNYMAEAAGEDEE